MDYTLIANLAEQLPELTSDTIVSRTLFRDDQLKVILFGFAPGQELSEHTSAMTAILHFLAGKATVTLGGDTFEVNAGAWVRMEPGLAHSIYAKDEPVTMLLLMMK